MSRKTTNYGICSRSRLTQSFKLILAGAFVPWLCFGQDWNAKLAAEYLDSRQKEWFKWPRAAVPGGRCVSCHTGATYLLVRPALRRALGGEEPTSYETGLLDGLRARVEKKEAKDVFPGLTKEPLASQGLGVEAIHAALFLAMENSEKNTLSPEAEHAFERLWVLQIRDGKEKGSWPWFMLNSDPHEMPESTFYGAALAALAVSSAPPAYRDRAEIRTRTSELAEYLQREEATQPLHNRLILLWATANYREALPDSTRKAIVEETWRRQQPDGGWTIEALGPWKPHPNAPPSSGSNSYATAIATLALVKSGTVRTEPRLARALEWLRSHQDRQFGYWPAVSMNKQRDPSSMEGQFMRDAATAFAALALIEAEPTRHKRSAER